MLNLIKILLTVLDPKHINDFVYKATYPFGEVFYFDNYVIGSVHPDEIIDRKNAMQILGDLKAFYKDRTYVFISNRTFHHDVDIKVYELVDPKKLVGIAIVSNRAQEADRAVKEQSHYPGSFGLFNNMDSAIAWASTFTMVA